MQLLHCLSPSIFMGEIELNRKKTKKKYTLRFKLNVLIFELETGTSYEKNGYFMEGGA